MSEPRQPDQDQENPPPQRTELRESLKEHLHDFVDALVHDDQERYEADFVMLLAKAQELVDQKRKMVGGKNFTRDRIHELLFTRLRLAMRMLMKSDEEVKPQRAAEWVAGALMSISTLSEFAQAFDRVLLSNNNQQHDFNFAGRTDFISVEEVLQMLCAGKHLGCLTLEKADNRLDLYLKDGRIVFLDPHHLIRRVMIGGDGLRHREIPEVAVAAAEGARTASGRPTLLALYDAGHLKRDELREVMRQFGKEVLFDFMRESTAYAFFYRRLDGLPAFAEEHDLRLGVTSVLLEGSKQVDDWRQMLTVFPDPEQPIEPRADMFARMGDLALGVLEIKLLSQINGEISPRGLAPVLGLPLHDVYVMLVRLVKDGIIAGPLGHEPDPGSSARMEESMEAAFAALDANDDEGQRQNALDSVFGGEGGGGGGKLNIAQGGPTKGSVLDKVFGGNDQKQAGSRSDAPLDQELLSIIKKNRR